MNLGGLVPLGTAQNMFGAWDVAEPIFSSFISSTETNDTPTDGHIANTIDGGYNELLAAGQASTSMGSSALTANPYSTRLRPITDVSMFSTYDLVYLIRAHFRALDATLTGNADQDAATLTAIENSLTSNNDAYVQSRFRLGEIGSWQPNFFRPYFSIKESGRGNVFGSMSSSNFADKNNVGDKSIGRMLPFFWDAVIPLNLGKIPNLRDALEVNAGVGQLVDLGGGSLKIQRYPIIAEFEFLGVKGYRQ